ncbi:MAG: hypothetical protein ACK5KP_09735 [Paludibacteraceae bacterium]
MKTWDLNTYGVQEMNVAEMRETDGGIIPFLILGGIALIMSSCTVVVGDNNNVGTSVSADSTANGNSAGTGSGNSVGN